MVYKFRVILDAEEDIFRDIAILADDTLEDLHNAIFNSFGFDGMEVASFYTCDETWNQEDEISLLIQETYLEQKIMSDYKLSDILDDEIKIIYVYDFINMWTFLVELAAMKNKRLEILKRCSHGEMPDEAMEKNFEADNRMITNDYEDGLDEDDLDMFEGDDSFEDFGFEENWN
jgi:hypothetical protein